MVFEKEEENTRWVFPRAAGRAMHRQSDAAGLGPGPNRAFTRDWHALSSHAACLGKLLFERVFNMAVTRTDTPVVTLETILQPHRGLRHSRSAFSSHPRAQTCYFHQGC